MPTDNSVQTATTSTVGAPPASSTQPALTEDFLKTIPYDLLKKSHPDVQTIETRYAAAHKELDGKKTKKELESEVARLKVLVGESDTPPPQSSLQTNHSGIDARKLQEEIEWNISNKHLILAAGQLYSDNLSKGLEKQDALDLALARRPSADTTFAEQLRSQITASSGGLTDRGTTSKPEIEGLSKEYVESLKKKFPNLPETRIAEMARDASSRKSRHGV